MVKKYTLILLCSIFFSLSVMGQKTEFKPEWNVGVGFGPTFSSVDFDPVITTSNWQQFHGGIAMRYISEKNLGLIAELNYSQQGWDQFFKDNPKYSYTHQLNYLELPILTHIYFGDKVRFVVNLGPKLSYLLSENEKMNEALSIHLSDGSASINEVTHQYYRMAERKIDYGLLIGAGMELRTRAGYFALEGRYAYGLGDIYKSTNSDFFQRSATRVMSVKLTYYIKIR